MGVSSTHLRKGRDVPSPYDTSAGSRGKTINSGKGRLPREPIVDCGWQIVDGSSPLLSSIFYLLSSIFYLLSSIYDLRSSISSSSLRTHPHEKLAADRRVADHDPDDLHAVGINSTAAIIGGGGRIPSATAACAPTSSCISNTRFIRLLEYTNGQSCPVRVSIVAGQSNAGPAIPQICYHARTDPDDAIEVQLGIVLGTAVWTATLERNDITP